MAECIGRSNLDSCARDLLKVGEVLCRELDFNVSIQSQVVLNCEVERVVSDLSERVCIRENLNIPHAPSFCVQYTQTSYHLVHIVILVERLCDEDLKRICGLHGDRVSDALHLELQDVSRLKLFLVLIRHNEQV